MDDRYGFLRKLLHWLVVILVVVQAALGLWLVFDPPKDEALATQLFAAHDGNGAVILVLMLLRLGLRWLLGVPVLPAGTPIWVMSVSELNHRLLYLVLIVQPVIGYFNNGANGLPWSLYGRYDIPAIISKNDLWAQYLGAAHAWGAVVLGVLVGLHLLGVAYHGIIRRDGVVRRMAF
jgi:cytochrome b561